MRPLFATIVLAISLLLAGADALQAESETLKTVEIRGSFADWRDVHNYRGWFVYVTNPSQDSEVLREEKQEAERFPVASDGSFEVVIHDAPIGEGYYLNCDQYGSQRFAVSTANVFITTVEPGD